ncbi:MAG: hypothetical protein ACOY3P_17660, partial [Planctomycetota bacterium]
SNQRLVVPAIWRAIREVGGEALVGRVSKRVSRALAEHYRKKIRSVNPKQRLRDYIRLLNEEGALVDAAEDNGRLVMHKRSCPFISMLDENQLICGVDLDMMSYVVGKPVRRGECRHQGAPCCTFEIAEDNRS